MPINVFFQTDVDLTKLFSNTDFLADKLLEYIELTFSIVSQQFDNLDSGVNVIICDNEYIQNLNSQYRNKNVATDVLSFGSNDPEIDNEIYISTPFILENERFKADCFFLEFIFILLHGFLHLYGYDHIDTNDKIEMNKEENRIFAILKEVIK